MTDREISTKDKLRYIYILEIQRKEKQRSYYADHIYYVGQTDNLARRMYEHLMQQNSKFLKKHFRSSSKKLVYVEYVYGSEFDALKRERLIKNMSRLQKEKQIARNCNCLEYYVPQRAIILNSYTNINEQVAIRLEGMR